MTLEIKGQHVPDILDCLAQLSNDEVPTPPKLARAMLDILPTEVWSNPDLKWLDPFCKSGIFLREAASRLLEGLSDWEPDFERRREHIYQDMLFGTSITEMTGHISRRTLYCSRDASGSHSVVRFASESGNLPFIRAQHTFPKKRDGTVTGGCLKCGAPLALERGSGRENYAYSFVHGEYPTKEMSGMEFDVIVGNPPYQVGTGGNGAQASAAYHRFVNTAIDMAPRYAVMITPSRWFSGGMGLDEFRDRMIGDRRLRKIVDNPKVYDCFPGVKIEGGVSYFLWDRDHSGDCEFSTRVNGNIVSTTTRDLRKGRGVLVRDNHAISILEKVRGVDRSVETVCAVTKPFGVNMMPNFKGSVPEPFPGAVPLIYGDKVGYSRPDQIERNHDWIDRYKVLLPMAFGDVGGSYTEGSDIARFTVVGEPIALAPGSACTMTYLVAGMFDTAMETGNYAKYLATKFVRFLVLQRKTTQHVRPDRFRFVPMLDMTREWTDADLYAEFALSDDEIAYVEASIKPRSVNMSLDSPIPASHLPGGYKYKSRVDLGEGNVDD